MFRRDFLHLVGLSATAAIVAPSLTIGAGMKSSVYRAQAMDALQEISEEPAVRAEVRVERGGPRLFVNDEETYPFMALSDHLLPTMQNFTNAGIRIIQPVLGMSTGWTGPGEYDWDYLDVYLGRLLDLEPDVYFLPRIHLYTPEWWRLKHPDEMIEFGNPPGERGYGRMRKFPIEEGAHWYDKRYEHWEASFASEQWRQDTADMLRNFIQHIEHSPLKSRVLGYFFGTGQTGEWNYFGSSRIPDYSRPVHEACGEIPIMERRTHTEMDLLRDPAQERDIIEFYGKFHDAIADTILGLAAAVREETAGRVLSGVFYGYLLEQTTIQEGGYLASRRIMESPDLDFIACPNTYQEGNAEGNADHPSGMVDGAGNWLGRARGVGGDGGYRGKPIQDILYHYSQLGKRRAGMDITPVSQILTVADDRSFAATQHWDQKRPWKNQGFRWCDFINHWLLNSQARTLHRIGAPVDFLYQFDFGKLDPEDYRLIFMLNPYYLSAQTVEQYREFLRDSGTTVVWVYAPGVISPAKLDLPQMKALTGFEFTMHTEPGNMFIRTAIDDEDVPGKFGVEQVIFPRFSVKNSDADILGHWDDLRTPAMARKRLDGWTSIYVGGIIALVCRGNGDPALEFEAR